MLKFSVKIEGRPESVVEVEARSFEVGADDSLPLVIEDPAASPKHLMIEVRPQGVVLRDLGTESGTRVNGSNVAQVRISVGDVIQVGAAKITFMVHGAEEPEPAPIQEDDGPLVLDDVPVFGPPAEKSDRGPRKIPRRRGTFVAPLAMLLLLGAGAAAGFYFLEQIGDEPKPVATLPPMEDYGPAEPSREPLPPLTDFEIPERLRNRIAEVGADHEPGTPEPDLPEPDLPEPAPEEPEPERPVSAPEPGSPPAEPGPEAARPDPGPSAEDEFRRARERLVAVGREKLQQFDETLPDRIRRYAFGGPIGDLTAIIEPLPDGAVRDEAAARLGDLEGARDTFDRFKKILAASKGRKVTLGSGLTLVVTDTDEEGFSAKVGPAVTKKKWTDVDPEAIHEVMSDEITGASTWIELASFAALYELYEDEPFDVAELDLLRAYRKDSALKPRVDETIARWRGVDPPSGGFVLHEGRWVTAEEKRYLDDGYVKHGGKWMTRDEVMTAKGYVQHDGRWLSPEEYEEVLAAQKEREELAKKYMPKGLIDKPGLTPEKPFGDVKTLKKGNYKVRTNLGPEVANDIAYTMEILRMNFKLVFGFRKRIPKLTVNVTATRQEFQEQWPGPGQRALGFFTSGQICTFYQPPMTTAVLMHEGTHEFLHKYAPSCPRWLHEGMATYFECSQFTFDEKKKRVLLKVGLLNAMRLASFQSQINADRAVSLDTFIRGKGGDPYAQGWAFVYYLAKGKDGQYSKHLHEFVKQSSASSKAVKNFQKIFRIRDLDAFEQEWREYIMSLNPADGVRLGDHR